jgi:protein-disulfide isomerase
MPSTRPSAKPTTKEKQARRAERAAAALREKQRRERRRQVITVVAVVAAIIAIIAGGYFVNSLRGQSQSEATAGAVPAPGSQYGLTLGASSAPHHVVVYEDFLCPFCAEFEKNSHEELARLADQGKVQVEYRPIVLLSGDGPYSARAALMFEAVHNNDGDVVAQKFHDLLYANQPSEQGPFLSRDDLYELAGHAGADVDALKQAVENNQGAQEVVDNTKKAQALGIDSTPTVFLDGTQYTHGRTPADLAKNLIQAVQ